MSGVSLELRLDAVPPGDVYTVVGNVETVGMYDTLIVETFEGFEIAAITVNGDNNLVGGDSIQAIAFAPGSQGPRLALGTHDLKVAGQMPAGTRLGLKVRNASSEPRPFQARFIASKS